MLLTDPKGFGNWLLVTGCWLLVAGYWLPANEYSHFFLNTRQSSLGSNH